SVWRAVNWKPGWNRWASTGDCACCRRRRSCPELHSAWAICTGMEHFRPTSLIGALRAENARAVPEWPSQPLENAHKKQKGRIKRPFHQGNKKGVSPACLYQGPQKRLLKDTKQLLCQFSYSGPGAVFQPTRRSVFSVLALLVVAFEVHAQFLDLAGQGVATPAQQQSGVATASGGVLEGRLDHDPLEGRHGDIQQVGLAAGQRLVGPLTQTLLPAAGRLAVLRRLQQLRRQVVDVH